jgi:hypothetical protein
MTVTQILEAARNNLNALTDTLWSDSELLSTLYRVELKLARRARTIENRYTTTAVAGTSQYVKPTRAIEIWRITYNGAKLRYIDFRQLDSINPNSADSSGTPSHYSYYDDAFFLYPAPADAGTIVVFSYDEPDVPTVSSTLETPSVYHDVLVDGLTAGMCPKDLGHPLTEYYTGKFEAGLIEAERFSRKRRRGDQFATVHCEEVLNTNQFGII